MMLSNHGSYKSHPLSYSYQMNENKCWPWYGYIRPDGYGEIAVNGERMRAHRYMYELLCGPIPDGLTVDHLCRNRRCVNPAHLEPVPPRENTQRAFYHGRERQESDGRSTKCKRGHEQKGLNVYFAPSNGARHCKPCRTYLEKLRRAKAKVDPWH